MKKNVIIFTGSRADYGILHPLIEKLSRDSDFNASLFVTGSHLSPELGMTVRDIENDEFSIFSQVEILKDTKNNLESMAVAISQYTNELMSSNFDLAVILGDRYEAFAFAVVCTNLKIPIVHLHGGESTLGAIDEVYRHCLTKMASLHFVSNSIYKKNVLGLGEEKDRVFDVGALFVDNFMQEKVIALNELKIDTTKNYFLLTIHPETLSSGHRLGIDNLLSALSQYKDRYDFIFTAANADDEGSLINIRIQNYCKTHANAHFFTSLGRTRYLSAVKHASLVIGNSSSGLIEVPYFRVPVINIGDRQKERLHPECVINSSWQKNELLKAIDFSLSNENLMKVKDAEMIFGDGNTAGKIIKTLKNFNFSTQKKYI